MSYYDYEASKTIDAMEVSYYGIIMAAMRRADSFNVEKLRAAWPEVYDELMTRYHAPGGMMPGESFPSETLRASVASREDGDAE